MSSVFAAITLYASLIREGAPAMPAGTIIGQTVGGLNFALNFGRWLWSLRHLHPQVTASAKLKEGKAVLSVSVKNTLAEPIYLSSVRAKSPIGASVGVVWGPYFWVLDDGPPPFKWPAFAEAATVETDLDPQQSTHFDVCVRRDPLIVLGAARIAVVLDYETRGPRQIKRSITILRTL